MQLGSRAIPPRPTSSVVDVEHQATARTRAMQADLLFRLRLQCNVLVLDSPAPAGRGCPAQRSAESAHRQPRNIIFRHGVAWRGGMRRRSLSCRARLPAARRAPPKRKATKRKCTGRRPGPGPSDCNRRSYLLCRARLTCFCLHLSHLSRAPITAQLLAS